MSFVVDGCILFPRISEAGDHGEEVGGCLARSWRPDLQAEVRDSEEPKPEAGRHGGWEFQEACLEVLPGEQ